MATTCKLIAKGVLTSSASQIEFTNIPSTPYADLFIVTSLRSAASAPGDDTIVRFNAVTTNYSYRFMSGNGSNAASSSGTLSGALGPYVNAATSTANTFGSGEIYIPNYAGSTNKSVSVTSAQEVNATGAVIYVAASLWANTAAISTVTLLSNSSSNFLAGSSAFLYGITRA